MLKSSFQSIVIFLFVIFADCIGTRTKCKCHNDIFLYKMIKYILYKTSDLAG